MLVYQVLNAAASRRRGPFEEAAPTDETRRFLRVPCKRLIVPLAY